MHRDSGESAQGRPREPAASALETSSASFPHAGTPGTPVGALGGSASGRSSPANSFPFPAFHDPRKMLSPKLPRALSVGQGISSLPRDLDARSQQLVPASPPVKRPYEADNPEEGRHPLPAVRHHSLSLTSTPSRSFSQPVSRSLGAHPGHHMAPQGGDQHGQPQPLSPYPHHQQGMVAPRPFHRPSTPTAESSPMPAWSEMLRRPGMGPSMVSGEGQQAFMTLPGSDTPIPVQVDYSQASKKADEKRQRNAKASTRHRRKKKTMQEENMRQLQILKDERQQMLQHIEELTHQRDFYRGDRNRLRDIVARTPSIGEQAAGPPSPPVSRITGSFSGKSPTMHHQQRPTTSHGYTSESSSIERPAQRRRIDDRPEFSIPSYGAPQAGAPGSLPPMHAQYYGGPPRPPSAASSGSIERLPPLRGMESQQMIQGPSQVHAPAQGHQQEQDPRTGQWVPLQPRQYETGWATTHRLAQDPPDSAEKAPVKALN
ncbi:hypothetical protein B0I35DRAFT_448551 [Stachybotrys elegans]|uniref:BZIP domain-containing protein n=1 Tax=Stachybotrys elegans TaxID=80388 RepID=A0A8K0T8Q5_9HYPO|nr:hypothetical protein B0I35DRAFT_448551 [Stachybotrys elegans]